MTAESLQAMQNAAASQAALASEAEELKRQMAQLPRGDNATLDEKRAVMRVYTRWQELEKRKEEAARQAEAGMPVRVMDGLPEDASVVGTIPLEGGWLAGVFGHGAFSLADGERQWTSRQEGLPGPWVLCLELSPWGQAFAGFFGAGLFLWRPDRRPGREWTACPRTARSRPSLLVRTAKFSWPRGSAASFLA